MNIGEHLKQLEMDLLSSGTRKDVERVSSLLALEFREFGSSGRVFSKNEIIEALQEESAVVLSLADFEMRTLAEDVVLVTYRSLKDGVPPITSLRSSIWVLQDDRWQMLFHQGTKVPALSGDSE